ncbi:hypothetical protein [Geotalea sp. SG265]|uniref:DUF7687 domain-containing protein n=1 Tax=Geotalea sp. SG265 TaxID=2922867 RepID=UPI001FB013BC|nr:hypothetical protein [Geotalea sp. SG265]
MQADKRFRQQDPSFWAYVRSISEFHGYSSKKRGKEKENNRVLEPTIEQIATALKKLNLKSDHVLADGKPTDLGRKLVEYFSYRAQVLNNFVEPRLMKVERAKAVYEQLKTTFKPTCPLPMNKQKGEKRTVAYFTAIINMLIEKHGAGCACDFNPTRLTTVTKDGRPLRTLSRRLDGAFPCTENPLAVWEVKEYYHTTTFGSRVADGVYETLLDGMELEQLTKDENIEVLHYLMIDAHYTWWVKGKSYLCRLFDMLHMGYIDELLVGYEVVEKLPGIVAGWVKASSIPKTVKPVAATEVPAAVIVSLKDEEAIKGVTAK